jgi:protein phosphatase 2C family protein 2/3
MEDSHTVHLHMPLPDSQASSAPAETDTELSTASKDIPVQPAGSTVSNDNQDEVGNALFGVFDGHGGSTVAKFSGSTMHTRLQGLESYSTYLFWIWRLELMM